MRNALLRAVLLGVPALVASGCVGGAGNYFETVSRETRAANAKKFGQFVAAPAQSPPAQNTDTVESAELKPINSQNTQPLQTTDTDTVNMAMAEPAPQNGRNDNITAQGAGEPLNIGLVQSTNGNVLLLPKANETGQDNSFFGSSTSAYADADNKTADSPAMASLAPGSGGLLQHGNSGFSIGSQTEPPVDPMEAAAEARIPLLYASISHGKCKQGFGPKPKKIGARRITPGDPYYIEIRMRQTPLLPVGHTYVAYGKLDGIGEPVDERLIMLAPVGGYAGAALASGIPMPGILTPHRDDCRIRPDVGYRVSLNAQRYEKLLREIRRAKLEKPSYLLMTNNCNHFMTRMAGSVGILPPRNIYLPAVQYLYAMIERNEGIRVSRW